MLKRQPTGRWCDGRYCAHLLKILRRTRWWQAFFFVSMGCCLSGWAKGVRVELFAGGFSGVSRREGLVFANFLNVNKTYIIIFTIGLLVAKYYFKGCINIILMCSLYFKGEDLTSAIVVLISLSVVDQRFHAQNQENLATYTVE